MTPHVRGHVELYAWHHVGAQKISDFGTFQIFRLGIVYLHLRSISSWSFYPIVNSTEIKTVPAKYNLLEDI